MEMNANFPWQYMQLSDRKGLKTHLSHRIVILMFWQSGNYMLPDSAGFLRGISYSDFYVADAEILILTVKSYGFWSDRP